MRAGPRLTRGTGVLAQLSAERGDAAPGRRQGLQVRLYLPGAVLSDVEPGADTADGRDVAGGQLGGEQDERRVAVAVQPGRRLGYSRVRLGLGRTRLGYGGQRSGRAGPRRDSTAARS